ncbi:MAG: hypothetical protein JXB45_01755 [Candidatus Krumholzibacteriota bacterium]|nr:hypothetical protein [Candidatus Krumholzibacteriota bacterium]
MKNKLSAKYPSRLLPSSIVPRMIFRLLPVLAVGLGMLAVFAVSGRADSSPGGEAGGAGDYNMLLILSVGVISLLIGGTVQRRINHREKNQLNGLIHQINRVAGSDFRGRLLVPPNEEAEKLVRAINALIGNWETKYLEEKLSDTFLIEKAKDLQREIQTVKEMESSLSSAIALAERTLNSKTEFFNNLSHELRTPMASIISASSILQSTELNDDQREMVIILKSASDSLMGLIENLLEMAKIETDKVGLKHVPFKLRESLESCLVPYVIMAQRKGIELKHEIEESVPDSLQGDIERLGHILGNVLRNAVKFTPRGSILLRVLNENENKFPIVKREGHSNIHFLIQDTGIGIPADQQERIFNSFVQVDGSMTREYGGAGLGLTITKKLVELMNGSIQVDSTTGEGSTFHLNIPFRHSPVGKGNEKAAASPRKIASPDDPAKQPDKPLRDEVMAAPPGTGEDWH